MELQMFLDAVNNRGYDIPRGDEKEEFWIDSNILPEVVYDAYQVMEMETEDDVVFHAISEREIRKIRRRNMKTDKAKRIQLQKTNTFRNDDPKMRRLMKKQYHKQLRNGNVDLRYIEADMRYYDGDYHRSMYAVI